jgi:hypothetical protein
MPLFETVTDLVAGAEVLRRRRYGVIEVAAEQLVRVTLRPFPKFVWLHEPFWGDWYHSSVAGDRCRLYYNQPRGFSNFLALKYMLSSRGTTLGTCLTAMSVLDEIARIKSTDAILCDAASLRISPRLLARGGWEPNKPSRWHRNYIKRFYGDYSPKAKDKVRRTKDEVGNSQGLSV